MRFTLGAGILSLLALVQPGMAFAQASNEAEQSCWEGQGAHVVVLGCLQEKAASSGKQVTRAESDVMTALKAWDMDAEYRQPALAAFTKASTRFKQWRAAQCSAMAAFAVGGNGDDYLRPSCEIDLNSARLRQILSYVQQLKR